MRENNENMRVNQSQVYYAKGMERLDYLGLGDEHAKRVLLVGAVTAKNVILVGPPGGGKTTLSENIYRLFDDIEPDEVQQVPASAELSDIQLVGGRMSTIKRITKDNVTTEEETTTDVPALIDSRVKILWLDEINRTNPLAINQLLPALENHRLVTTAGRIELPNLVMAISTMNPSETDEAAFKLAVANTSRHAMGAIVPFHINQEERSKNVRTIGAGWNSDPSKIETYTSTKELKQIGEWALSLQLTGKPLDRFVDLEMKANDTLRNELGIDEADWRMAAQIRDNAKAFSAIDGHQTVMVGSVEEAVKAGLVARIASQKKMKNDAIDEIVQSIVA